MSFQLPTLNVLLIGDESAGIQTLRALESRKDRIVAVMGSPPDRGRASGSLWAAASRCGLQVQPAELVKDPSFAGWVRSEEVDVLLNVHSLHIIHPDVVVAPRIGSFNLHPGPLPNYAGLNPVSWAIYRGENQYGVTVHQMTKKVDAGPIAYQERFPIGEQDTPLSLTLKCVRAGIPLLMRLLDAAASGLDAIPRAPQDPTQRRYFGREVPDGGLLSWDRPAREVVNFVRACDYYPFPSPWGQPRARLGDREIVVTKMARTGKRCTAPPGTTEDTRDDGVLVACADEWVLLLGVRVNQQSIDPRLLLKSG